MEVFDFLKKEKKNIGVNQINNIKLREELGDYAFSLLEQAKKFL